MTKEITKAIILQEIQDKLGLREFESARFLFDEKVVPIYDIEPHLQKWRSFWYDITISSAAPYLIATVPETERWKLRAYTTVFVSGVYTIAGIFIYRKLHRTADDFSYLDLKAGQNVSYLVTLPEAVVLEPEDKLQVNVDGYTSSGSFRVFLDYQKEEIR